jgi:hypothetical protein
VTIDNCLQYNITALVVKATFKHTTQNMRLPPSTYLHKLFKSPNPSATLKRRDKADSTKQIYLDTPAINGGEKSAHLFVGKKSKLTASYKAKDSLSADFLKCLQDQVQYRGCPTGLEADNASMYRGWKNSVYGGFLVVLRTSQVLCNKTGRHARLDASLQHEVTSDVPFFAQILALWRALKSTNPTIHSIAGLCKVRLVDLIARHGAEQNHSYRQKWTDSHIL